MAAVQTYKNLQDKVLRALDEAGDTDTTLALVKDGLNYANTQRTASERWRFMLWDSAVTFVTVLNQQAYALHSEYFRPAYFYNRTTGNFLREIAEGALKESRADWINDVDSALQFTLWSRTEVQNQPAVAIGIAVASSNGADNGSRTVIVRGDTASGVRSETITCGSTGAILFTKILKVTKKGTWVGTLTLSAGAVTCLTLFPEEAGRSYQQLYLLALPPAGEIVEYKFYRQPAAMVEDEDRPDIPTPYEDLLVFDALLGFAAYNDYPQGVVAVWIAKQKELLIGLQQAYADDQSLEAATQYTSYVPR